MKEFLTDHGVRFTLKDLRTDEAAQHEFRGLGFRLPPVTVINGRAIEGYQPAALEALLEAAESDPSDSRPAG